MIKVFALRDACAAAFKKMFSDYYKELGCDDDGFHIAEEYVIPDLLSGLLHVDLASVDDEICGFAVYQIDRKENEWNFKEGFGDVREIYITPPHRRKGFGQFLLYSAEMKLREAGADGCYCVPDEYSVDFFRACGYSESGETCPDLGGKAFIKKLGCGCKN